MKKIYRLVSNDDFSLVVKKGRTLKDDSFTIHFLKNDLSHSRVGISASTKLGHAVVRNKIRRQIRAIVDQKLDFNNIAFDIVIIARNGFLTHSFQDNKNTLNYLLDKIVC